MGWAGDMAPTRNEMVGPDGGLRPGYAVLGPLLDRLSGHPVAGTWLLSTDADTTVPPDWARAPRACSPLGTSARSCPP